MSHSPTAVSGGYDRAMASQEVYSPGQKRLRLVILVLLVCGIAGGVWFAGFTETGKQIMEDHEAVGQRARSWVEARPVLSVGLYLLTYLACALLMLPIWWLQILAGFVFGLGWGCAYALTAAGISATVTTVFSRWLGGAWFRQRVEARMERVQRLEEKLGHNGLLVVMAVRLMYFLPFGISNYLFGLTRITAGEVFLGSILGGFPALTIYVTIGADPLLFKSWRYWLILGSINLVLVMPLLLRYLWPERFRRIGVE
mgnify:CR=1 FL=1